MAKGDTPTIKQRKFVKEYLENGGNGTQAALKAYNTSDLRSAKTMASENLTKLTVKQLLEQQSEYAMYDQISIREELKESKKDYAVRSTVNRDILDRAGYKPVDKIEQTNVVLSVNLDL